MTILETIEGDYVKAVSAVCLAVPFLMLATGFTGDGPEKPFWRKVVVFVLVATSIALLIYRTAIGRLLT